MIGLNHLAIPYYEETLEKSQATDKTSLAVKVYQLRAPAAHNLAELYRSCGSTALATRLLYRHNIV